MQVGVRHVGIDLEFERLPQTLHVRRGARHSRCEPGVVIAGERHDRRLDLGHRRGVRRRTIETDRGIESGDRGRALPCHAAAVAEAGDTAFPVGARQFESVVTSRSDQLHFVRRRTASERLGEIVRILK